MGNPKKRVGWDLVVEPKSKQWFPIEYVKQIITKNKILLKDDIEKDLEAISEKLKWAAEFFDSTEIIGKGPSIPEIRAALMDFKRKAEKLSQSMKELDYRSKCNHLLAEFPSPENEVFQIISKIQIDKSAYKDNEPPGALEFFEATQDMVDYLADRSKTALAKLPTGKVGHPKEYGFNSFINQIDEIYKQLTGQHGGLTKPFLGFAYDCLSHIDKAAQSMSSLKQRVKLLREGKQQP